MSWREQFLLTLLAGQLFSGYGGRVVAGQDGEATSPSLEEVMEDEAVRTAKFLSNPEEVEQVGVFSQGGFHGCVIRYKDKSRQFLSLHSHGDTHENKEFQVLNSEGEAYENRSVPSDALPQEVTIQVGGKKIPVNLKADIGWYDLKDLKASQTRGEEQPTR